MEYMNQFRLKGNIPKVDKLRHSQDNIPKVDKLRHSQDILKIEARMKELEEEDMPKPSNLGRISVFLRKHF